MKPLFRQAAKALTEQLAITSGQTRRRKGDGDARGAFILAGVRVSEREVKQTRQQLPRGGSLEFFRDIENTVHAIQDAVEQECVAKMAADAQATEPGAVIAWLLASGYSMDAIRAMFPGLFDTPPPEEPTPWGTFDHFNPHGFNPGCFDEFIWADQNHMDLQL